MLLPPNRCCNCDTRTPLRSIPPLTSLYLMRTQVMVGIPGVRVWMDITIPITVVAGILLSIGLATNIYVLVKVSVWWLTISVLLTAVWEGVVLVHGSPSNSLLPPTLPPFPLPASSPPYRLHAVVAELLPLPLAHNNIAQRRTNRRAVRPFMS